MTDQSDLGRHLPINRPDTLDLRQLYEWPMFAVEIYASDCVMLFAPGVRAWRQSTSAHHRSLGQRKVIAAREQGCMISVHHLRFDPNARSPSIGRDCIDRPYLTIGPMEVAHYCIAGTDDLYGHLDRIFAYSDDADRAADRLVRMLRASGLGSVIEVERVAR